ncbi:ABC transporter permease [Rhizobium sp. 1399]|jgi:putative spermidine/putrescine transport system permease protein|uniref:ABC transporter permease n=1 Tax=Rhizobium sp. 1399 TaxID=2817758 RepID=UPI0028565DC1|nr:ABC transporter permease [Rhizobium sp. 1399]MDR6665264.1 putative spermidine/putrescine transport system permease protein [Rhizobium sp. 1399]
MTYPLKRTLPMLLVLPGTLIVLGFLVLPVLATFSDTIGPAGQRLSLYTKFFGVSYNIVVLVRSLRIALIATIISLCFGFCAATVISRSSGTYRQALLIASVFPLLTGAIVRSFAWMVILGRNGVFNSSLMSLGLIDTPLPLLFTEGSLIVGLVYLFTPLAILSLIGVIEVIDQSVIDAATSLGASPFGVLRQVTLPLIAPGLLVGGVLVFTGSLAAFATGHLLGGEAETILPTLLQDKAMVSFDWDAAGVIAVVMVAITFAVVLLGQYAAGRLNPAAG